MFYSLFQAGLLINGYELESEPLDESLEALRLEHFYLPLLLWVGGTVLSLLSLMAEIFIKRREAGTYRRPEPARRADLDIHRGNVTGVDCFKRNQNQN